ncbi:MAG: carbamoyltransferase HypF [Acidimicrobiales bacterium]
MTPVGLQRHRIRVAGVVQGVGFRPFVYRLAAELGLAGHAGNDSAGVFVEVEGEVLALASFEARLVGDAPPLARVDRVETARIAFVGDGGFCIVDSDASAPGRTYVSPDVALCGDCLRELLDPADRRFRYPFINCTNCGPRFTITIRLPYDRPNTTMAGFAMCPACAAEYRDPADRRFHAQPVACAHCGPRLWYEGATGTVQSSDDAISAAQDALVAGATVAVKGLGGFHLACDGASDEAVGRLRMRKARQDKPFAVMVADLDAARRLAEVGREEAALLEGAQRPIVLLRRRAGARVSELVAPANPYMGVLLPYTPVHHLLFATVPARPGPVPEVLVMTSGNLSEEPICFEDADARRRLGSIADGWLVHDRPIHVPCDDSVMRIVGGAELPIRRSRGYSPLPVSLPFEAAPILGVGGELKNTFCLAQGRDAWMSQHIGDMGSVETLRAFEASVPQFSDLYGVDPTVAAVDAHPGYQTRAWAERDSRRALSPVQHHHAHVAAAMVEHGLGPDDKVIGFAFDGTGYGDDGAVWGSEVLLATYGAYERVGHLAYVSLPGGDAAIRRPYRCALSHLREAGIAWAGDLAPVKAASAEELVVLARQLERGIACVPTSSMGRLFDAVSSLTGLRHLISYEAQAAIELEAAAYDHLPEARQYRFGTGDAGEVEPAPMLRAIVADLRAGVPPGPIAAGFHLAVSRLIGETASKLHGKWGIDLVVLSGGVFQNALLTRLATAELAGRGLQVLCHHLVPPNDGGIALGQVAVAAHRSRDGAR